MIDMETSLGSIAGISIITTTSFFVSWTSIGGTQAPSVIDEKPVFPKKSSNILSISSLKEGNLDSHKPLHGVRAINPYLLYIFILTALVIGFSSKNLPSLTA